MKQDIISIKTMLLKLRRVLNEVCIFLLYKNSYLHFPISCLFIYMFGTQSFLFLIFMFCMSHCIHSKANRRVYVEGKFYHRFSIFISFKNVNIVVFFNFPTRT